MQLYPDSFKQVVLTLETFTNGPDIPDILNTYELKFVLNILKRIKRNQDFSEGQRNFAYSTYNKLVWLGYVKENETNRDSKGSKARR